MVFTIIFAILEKIQLFGTEKTNINITISLIFGFLLIVQREIVRAINEFLPRMSLLIVILLMGLLIINLVRGKETKNFLSAIFSTAVFLFIVNIFLAVDTNFNVLGFLSPYDKEAFMRNAIFLMFLAFAIWFIVGKKGVERKPRFYMERGQK